MLPQVDPKFTFWFGVWTNILILIAGYGVQHAPAYVALYAPDVQWFAGLGAQVNGLVLTALAGISSSKAGPFVNVPTITPQSIAKVIIFAFAVSFLLAGSSAQAEIRRPVTAPPAQSSQLLPLTGNAQQDLANLLKRITIAPAPTTPDEIQGTTCDFSIFSKLTVDNAVPLLEKCAQSVDANVTAPLVNDTEKALDSAKAYGCGDPAAATCPGNGMAVACLTPALALLKAAEGTPPVKDANGVVTTPGIAPGVITIGEKLDEFVQAGGPSNCKAVIQRVVNGLAATALTP